MANLVTELLDSYHYSLKHSADPRTQSWPLLWNDYRYVLVLTSMYLLFVWIGPKVMRSRPAFSLRAFMFVYNACLVALSLYMTVEMILAAIHADYKLLCTPFDVKVQPLDPREMRMANVLWWYFFSKAIEFMDTVLMILRKKQQQVTFLHVLHHATMLNIWWFITTFTPGGLAYFGALLNCFVHVVMYSYYFLSSWPAMQPYLWWKRYITRLQLLQFIMIFIHTSWSMYSECPFPFWGKLLLWSYMIVMFTLFSNFYIQTYKRRRSAKGNTNGKESVSNGTMSNGTEYTMHDKKSL